MGVLHMAFTDEHKQHLNLPRGANFSDWDGILSAKWWTWFIWLSNVINHHGSAVTANVSILLSHADSILILTWTNFLYAFRTETVPSLLYTNENSQSTIDKPFFTSSFMPLSETNKKKRKLSRIQTPEKLNNFFNIPREKRIIIIKKQRRKGVAQIQRASQTARDAFNPFSRHPSLCTVEREWKSLFTQDIAWIHMSKLEKREISDGPMEAYGNPPLALFQKLETSSRLCKFSIARNPPPRFFNSFSWSVGAFCFSHHLSCSRKYRSYYEVRGFGLKASLFLGI